MTQQPDLFTGTRPQFDGPAALPAEPTDTQRVAAARVHSHLPTMRERVLQLVTAQGRLGATPGEATRALSPFDDAIVTYRARFTELHQAGILVRTAQVRDGQHVYVTPEYWTATMGQAPSRPHRGRP